MVKRTKKPIVSAINVITLKQELLQKILSWMKELSNTIILQSFITYYQSFITLKDHKENFENNLKCRLINPANSEIGIVNKHYIGQINKSIREKLNVNQ